jgi:hypothetical protein
MQEAVWMWLLSFSLHLCMGGAQQTTDSPPHLILSRFMKILFVWLLALPKIFTHIV